MGEQADAKPLSAAEFAERRLAERAEAYTEAHAAAAAAAKRGLTRRANDGELEFDLEPWQISRTVTRGEEHGARAVGCVRSQH